MRIRFGVAAAILGLAAISAACGDKKSGGAPPSPIPPGSDSSTVSPATATNIPANAVAGGAIPKFEPELTRLFPPVPEGVEKPTIDPLTKLGWMLFSDPRISGDGKSSCISCHDLEKVGADGLAVPVGKKQELPRNTPTVINCGGSFSQGWDARSPSVEEFALPHVLDPAAGGVADEKALVAILQSIPGYVGAFKTAFPDEKAPITGETFGRAVGEYTKKLFARSRWDRYLGGDKSQMKDDELTGFAMFVEAGCTSCHQGKYIGATQSQKLGMARPWPAPQGTDPGRFAYSKQEMDRGMFKVPTLRNVTRTGPWLHDGSATSLEEVIKLMARHQVGRELNDAQAKSIVTFFGALEGEPPPPLTSKPMLPASGPKTPKPAP